MRQAFRSAFTQNGPLYYMIGQDVLNYLETTVMHLYNVLYEQQVIYQCVMIWPVGKEINAFAPSI